jgi:1-acyl-sn-glycerol-3-phosphate acyltransferase
LRKFIFYGGPVKKKNKGNKVNKPNAVLYFCVAPFVKIYFRLVFRHQVNRTALRGIHPPYLVLAGHSSWLDYLITGASMFPVRMNYVGAYNFFRDRLLNSVFGLLGVIPRRQFTSDLSSIMMMKYCVDNKRVVAIFPHGCLSNEGRPGGFAGIGIAKLIKFLRVPVVVIKTDGAYLTRPRWSRKARRGRIESKIIPILTIEEIDALSNRQIYGMVTRAIDFDDYKWQRQRMIPYKGKNPAQGADFVLYRCPKCHNEFTLRTKESRMFCTMCGNAVRMNRYLLFEPESEDTVYFDGIDRWYDFQKDCLDMEIDSPDFELTSPTELQNAEPNKFGYQHRGFGQLRLTREALFYTGEIDGEKAELVLPMKNIPMIPYAADEYIEVARGEEIHRFVLDDHRQMMKWVMAVRQIRDKFYEEG